MSHINLKEIERRAYRSTFQDGLWDIFLGLIFLPFAVGPLLRNQGMSETTSMLVQIVYTVIILLGMMAGKRYVTVPRLGYVQFGPQRKRKLAKTRVILGASVALGLLVMLLVSTGDITLTAILALFTANTLIVLGGMAYYLDYTRLYGYAVMWALSLPLGVLLEKYAGLGDAGYVFFVTATIPALIGLVLFVRFLRDYPLPEEEPVNGAA